MQKTISINNATVIESNGHHILTFKRDEISIPTVYAGDDFPQLFLEAQRLEQPSLYHVECSIWRPKWTTQNYTGGVDESQEWYLTNNSEEIDLSILAGEKPISIEHNKVGKELFILPLLYHNHKKHMIAQAQHLAELEKLLEK